MCRSGQHKVVKFALPRYILWGSLRLGGAAMHRRILVIDHKVPTPDQDSGSASAFSYLQILARAGYEVFFAPHNLAPRPAYRRILDRLGVTSSARYLSELRRIGVKPLTAPQWTSIDSVVENVSPTCDLLLLYRAPYASKIFELARRAAPSAKILFHAVDLHFLRMEREAKLLGDPLKVEAASIMRQTELRLVSQADATIVVSEYESSLLRTLTPLASVHQIPILREATPITECNWDNRRDFLFIGGFEHAPNADAVLWFVREVWPKLQAMGYSDSFTIVGSHVPPAIKDLASDRIVIRGYVRDLPPLFREHRLSVAPLRYGGGIKGKIVTSLSFGLPVVATSMAAEGMGLGPDDGILVADAADRMAEQIFRLYNDSDLWRGLSSNGYLAFQNRFSLEAGTHKVLAVINNLLGAGDRPEKGQTL
jgi:O-antigen biosynthesis protein